MVSMLRRSFSVVFTLGRVETRAACSLAAVLAHPTLGGLAAIMGIRDWYEPQMVAMRRMAIQALSTTGSKLGFSRSTLPDCPMAYPHGFREFQQKRSELCEATVQERDALLTQRGGTAVPFGKGRSADVARVYRAYALE
jgi:hypothetical protein